MGEFVLFSDVGFREFLFRWFVPVTFEFICSVVGCWLAFPRCWDGIRLLVLLGIWFLLGLVL